MPQLRWALIGLGLLFLAGLALWEWRRSRRLPGGTTRVEPRATAVMPERTRRMEPGLGDMAGVRAAQPEEPFELPSILPIEPLPVAPQEAVDVPAAARGADGGELAVPADTAAPAPPTPPAIRWPPPAVTRVLALRVVKSGGEPMAGRALRAALEVAGLASGPQSIFHRADADGAVIVSAADLVQPGTLDATHMDAASYRGISLFSVLPGPLPPPRMLEELVGTARSLAQRLGAIVQDEKGADLDGPRLAELRRSLPEGGGRAGGGAAP
ncbi:MAG TPA: cell division protein ZipA C-terminal FtsZ-binding domain-containing protein [Steroidobacteraceae bacterium]|nr:cell division protein ZipA C-terminal FtsZ-binding domain-containing protein [Steroidobacteraceae bacterium]